MSLCSGTIPLGKAPSSPQESEPTRQLAITASWCQCCVPYRARRFGQTYLGTEAITPPPLLIPRSRNWKSVRAAFQTLRSRRPDGNTKSANSAKTPIANEPASAPFQVLMNGMRVALVNVEGRRNFRFGGEAMPMSPSIERLDSEVIAVVCTCMDGCKSKV
jgi:hypothetical protein